MKKRSKVENDNHSRLDPVTILLAVLTAGLIFFNVGRVIF